MKKLWISFILMIALYIFAFPISTLSARAETQAEIEASIEEEVNNYLDNLDLSEFERFLSESNAPSEIKSPSIKDVVGKIVKGDIPLDFGKMLSYIGSQAVGVLTGTLAALLTVMILAVMSSIMSGLTSGFVKKQTIEIVHYVFYALVVSIVLVRVGGIVQECRDFTKGVNTFTEGVFPPLITLMSALGGSVSASVYKPQLALFALVMSNVFGKVILPLFIAAIAFCLISNLSSSVKMDKFQSAIRYSSTLILSCLFGLFITYLTVAGITGGMVDGVSIKAAKFVLSSYVPILGGYLSQGFDLISAGCVLIKNAIGVLGILSVLFLVMRPILHITIFSFSLKIVASLIQPIGDKRISDFLYSVSNATKILVTSIVGTGFVLIVTLLLMVVTCNVGVI